MSLLTRDLEAWVGGVKSEKEIRVMQRRIKSIENMREDAYSANKVLVAKNEDLLKRLVNAEAALHIIKFVVSQIELTIEKNLT